MRLYSCAVHPPPAIAPVRVVRDGSTWRQAMLRAARRSAQCWTLPAHRRTRADSLTCRPGDSYRPGDFLVAFNCGPTSLNRVSPDHAIFCVRSGGMPSAVVVSRETRGGPRHKPTADSGWRGSRDLDSGRGLPNAGAPARPGLRPGTVHPRGPARPGLRPRTAQRRCPPLPVAAPVTHAASSCLRCARPRADVTQPSLTGQQPSLTGRHHSVRSGRRVPVVGPFHVKLQPVPSPTVDPSGTERRARRRRRLHSRLTPLRPVAVAVGRSLSCVSLRSPRRPAAETSLIPVLTRARSSA